MKRSHAVLLLTLTATRRRYLSSSETAVRETAAAAAAQTNLADTVAGLSAVGGAAAHKHKMGMYALGTLTGGG